MKKFSITRRGSNTWLILLMALLGFYAIIRFQRKRTILKRWEFETWLNDVKPIPNIEFKNWLMSELKRNGFSDITAADIVAQSAFETGNFTSRIFKENNNPFGMKLPQKRLTTATGERYAHANYNTLADSVRDYRLYWDYWRLPDLFTDTYDFVKALKDKGYFTANFDQYLNGVKLYYQLYFPTK